MYILIDWGNTRLKYLRVDKLSNIFGQKPLIANSIDHLLQEIKPSIVKDGLSMALITSVRSKEETANLCQKLKANDLSCFVAKTAASACGVQCGYRHPEQLGIDRWLAIIAATQDGQSDQAIGIIDVGSAITLDLVKSKRHLGGHILPGKKLLINSLLNTANVVVDDSTGFYNKKQDSNKKPALALGHSTDECVDYATDQLIGSYLLRMLDQAYSAHRINRWLITGGGGEYWSNWLTGNLPKRKKNQLIYRPELVFHGLAAVFQQKQQ